MPNLIQRRESIKTNWIKLTMILLRPTLPTSTIRFHMAKNRQKPAKPASPRIRKGQKRALEVEFHQEQVSCTEARVLPAAANPVEQGMGSIFLRYTDALSLVIQPTPERILDPLEATKFVPPQLLTRYFITTLLLYPLQNIYSKNRSKPIKFVPQ